MDLEKELTDAVWGPENTAYSMTEIKDRVRNLIRKRESTNIPQLDLTVLSLLSQAAIHQTQEPITLTILKVIEEKLDQLKGVNQCLLHSSGRS